MRIPTAHPQENQKTSHFDLAVVALGYEQRATHLVRKGHLHGKDNRALGFSSNQVLSFSENEKIFRQEGFEVQIVSDDDFQEAIESILYTAAREATEPMSVGVDISSFSRSRLATIIKCIKDFKQSTDFIVDFFYSLALYDEPPTEAPPNRHIGPVLPSFAGWTGDPESSVTNIIGLGYEPERALGAVEQVQGGSSWLFLPTSPIGEYEVAVRDSNELLLESLGPEHLLTYPVLDPYHTFVSVEALASRCLRTGGCIIFPFGPKTFTLIALIVGCLHDDVAVWRVSAGDLQPPRDRKESQFYTSLRVDFVRD